MSQRLEQNADVRGEDTPSQEAMSGSTEGVSEENDIGKVHILIVISKLSLTEYTSNPCKVRKK